MHEQQFVKTIIITVILGALILSCSKKISEPTIKSILIEELKNTHNKQDWYVPIGIAVKDLTIEQSNWKDSSDNHSIGQLVSHLVYWNERVLIAFKGNTPPNFDGNNEATFNTMDQAGWEHAIKKLDSIQTIWEQVVEKASDRQLKDWSTSIANMCAHNAYHTGQIIYIRKRNGWWPKPR